MTLKEHHVLPTGCPVEFWGPNGQKLWAFSSTIDHEKRTWRFIRVIILPCFPKGSNQEQEAVGQTIMELRGIEFFGTVKKLFVNQEAVLRNKLNVFFTMICLFLILILVKLTELGNIVSKMPATQSESMCCI